ncbi:hypothetical protein SJC10_16 [Bacteroides phage SJC10]|nr:hypothetical protein SJC10_16 [Bacteroides phage SJC10]
MARAKKTVTKDINPTRELIILTDEFEILNLCKSMTHLKLDAMCHMDRAYAKKWYEEHYLTGVHVRYVMKPGMSINHVADGVVYRAFNCTDAIAERLMNENKAYIAYFDDLGPLAPPTPEDEPEAAPEAPAEPEPEPEAPAEEEPQPEAAPEPEAPAEPAEPEKTVEEELAELG